MRTIIITRGPPAAGKSTWAREQLKLEPARWIRLNKDEFRLQVFGDRSTSAADEKLIADLQRAMLKKALHAGRDVIVDNMNLSVASVREIHDVANSIGDTLVVERVFPVTLEECIARDAIRTPSVGADVIHDVWRRYGLKNAFPQPINTMYDPIPELLTAKQDESLPECMVVDLDGTAALIGARNPYDASHCDELDQPNVAVVAAVLALRAHRDCAVIFVSGRSEKFREPTVRFIEKYFVDQNVLIPYELHMRPIGDMRRDVVIKRMIYDQHIAGRYRVLVVIDDRPCVVRMWRRDLKLMTFAVNDKEF